MYVFFFRKKLLREKAIRAMKILNVVCVCVCVSLRFAVMIFDKIDLMMWSKHWSIYYSIRLLIFFFFFRLFISFFFLLLLLLHFISILNSIWQSLLWYDYIIRRRKIASSQSCIIIIHIITTSKWPWLCSLAFISKTITQYYKFLQLNSFGHGHIQKKSGKKREEITYSKLL